jgi:legumain
VIRARGIPSDHIIVMHYDNMAYNPKNPKPGAVINDVNGTDVYHNVPKDYTGDDVDPQVYMILID